jgi:hypothetical protein
MRTRPKGIPRAPPAVEPRASHQEATRVPHPRSGTDPSRAVALIQGRDGITLTPVGRLRANLIQTAAVAVILFAGMLLVPRASTAADHARPPLTGAWKLAGKGDGFTVEARGDRLFVSKLRTRFLDDCPAHPQAVAEVPGPLLIKRKGGAKDPEWAATGDVRVLIGGKLSKGHLVLIFSPQYPDQLLTGNFGVEGCSAGTFRGHHR